MAIVRVDHRCLDQLDILAESRRDVEVALRTASATDCFGLGHAARFGERLSTLGEHREAIGAISNSSVGVNLLVPEGRAPVHFIIAECFLRVRSFRLQIALRLRPARIGHGDISMLDVASILAFRDGGAK